jgi:hypothetical protein
MAARRSRFGVDGRQLLAGLCLGLAAAARLPLVLGLPFLVLVGSGGDWVRRGWSAGIGMAIPLVLLVGYNVASTGSVFHPAYDYQYRLEAVGYPELGYRPDWSIEDPRYLPQNLEIMFLSLPAILPATDPATGSARPLCTAPDASRGLFDPACPIAMPRDVGMSVLLVSPAFLLAIPVLVRGWGRRRLVTGAGFAALLIALLNLMHFSQGWVQFGYRFSNDLVPFILPLVALGLAAASRSVLGAGIAGALIVASIAVNAWGVAWGAVLGW